MKITKITFAFILLLFLTALAYADDRLILVEASGETVLGDDMTLGLAKDLARSNARRRAIEQATGVVVHGATVIYNYELISDLISVYTGGIIVKEDILTEGQRIEGAHVVYFSRIRAHVKLLQDRKKALPTIQKADIIRWGSLPASSAPVFQDKDELQVRATVNEKVYLHVFSISQEGLVQQLYPNEYVDEKPVNAGDTFIFPDERLRGLGLKMRLHTPKTAARALETVMIVATKEKVVLLTGSDGTKATVSDLMQNLAGLATTGWTEKTLGYEVRK